MNSHQYYPFGFVFIFVVSGHPKPYSSYYNRKEPSPVTLLGSKWGDKSPNMSYDYGYPTYNPTYNYP